MLKGGDKRGFCLESKIVLPQGDLFLLKIINKHLPYEKHLGKKYKKLIHPPRGHKEYVLFPFRVLF